ncbi:MAG: hypothetical protein AAGF12_34990 [Myxococcota bacterium]
MGKTLGIVLVSLVWGCGGDDSPVGVDATIGDASSDRAVNDAPADSAEDGSVDGAADGMVDATVDGAADAGRDGSVDAQVDASRDGRADGNVDAMTGCRSTMDCSRRFEICYAPGDRMCGIVMMPLRMCETSATCPGSTVCQEFSAGPCAIGLSSRCSMPCPGRACMAEEVCTAEGICIPAPCSDGSFACPAGTACVPAGGDEHGCARMICRSDATCPAGLFCVNNQCHETLGICSPPVA